MKFLVPLPIGSFAANSFKKDAYTIIPIHPVDYHIKKLAIRFKDRFYFDKVLPQAAVRAVVSLKLSLLLCIPFFNFYPKCVHLIDVFLFICL